MYVFSPTPNYEVKTENILTNCNPMEMIKSESDLNVQSVESTQEKKIKTVTINKTKHKQTSIVSGVTKL